MYRQIRCIQYQMRIKYKYESETLTDKCLK
ncbi:hypothetical protein THOM_2411 [Trachipleistophora hominis]|uniref:Uncharacterized protein n=1 Tax=Trachipleistophora hominis TaxID=72359 RepID=L7JTP1_TRAHO|nr:hypothetical protein THOM_2411 [Trachipleistophora hominis]